ncbi:hypothetical protein P692DRAFT_201872905 [Suillus brevipes Sb2]|nr:hypothetical protein P692DRAFT_201872905 [Suillus brevipes Sb2]
MRSGGGGRADAAPPCRLAATQGTLRPLSPLYYPVYNATSTIHANSSTPTPSASPTPTPIVLATRITPAFGVLGAILIITGLPSAFWGQNRWTSFFLIGFYTLSLVCFVLIVKFGILPAINPPNNTLQGTSDTKHSDVRKAGVSLELEDLARKEELLAEIQTIRRSINALRSETLGLDSDDSRSRRISLTSRRTLSYDLDNAIAPRPHTRPPRQPDPRGRAQSMELSKLIDAPPLGASIGRPTSVPLRDDDWDSYVRDRKLLQPPAGVTAPIPTSRLFTTGSLSAQQRLPVPSAVTEALSQRKHWGSLLDPDVGPDTSAKDTSDEDAPIATLAAARAHTRKPKPYFNSTIPVASTPSQPPAASARYPPAILSRSAGRLKGRTWNDLCRFLNNLRSVVLPPPYL